MGVRARQLLLSLLSLPQYNGDSRFPTHCTHLSYQTDIFLAPFLSLPLQTHPSTVPLSPDTAPLPSPISAPTPAEGSTPLLQLCPLPLATLYYILVLLGHFWRHRPACLPQGQDLEGTKGAVSQSEAQLYSPPYQAQKSKHLPSFLAALGQRPAH